MEKRVILNNIKSNWTIDETGRLKNINNNNYLKGAIKLEPHEIERLENDLREVLQLPLMLIVA